MQLWQGNSHSVWIWGATGGQPKFRGYALSRNVTANSASYPQRDGKEMTDMRLGRQDSSIAHVSSI